MKTRKYFICSFVYIVGIAMVLNSCSNSYELNEDRRDNAGGSANIMLKTSSTGDYTNYAHYAYTYRENVLVDKVSSSTSVFPDDAFVFDKGMDYQLKLVAVKASENIGYDEDLLTWEVKDTHADIPVILAGNSETIDATSDVVPVSVEMKGVVGYLSIEVTGVPANVSDITVTIKNMYDRYSLDGTYSHSSGPVAKTIILTRNADTETTFEAPDVVVMPTAENDGVISLTYTLNYNDGSEPLIIDSTPAGAVGADVKTLLHTEVSAVTPTKSVSGDGYVIYDNLGL